MVPKRQQRRDVKMANLSDIYGAEMSAFSHPEDRAAVAARHAALMASFDRRERYCTDRES
jgi:hypothetical protein